ncbi:MAG: HAMP domain-containing protein [Myxococcaceae bacterium]|nr:HAMP domain-containing protein [Myxococcaceae bacterium]
MTFRTRLLLAEAPLALALAVIGLVAVLTVGQLGRAGEEVLANNYRSVLAAQRMKEALERIDSGVLFVLAGERAKGEAQIALHRPRFEDELKVQESNITEQGEREATERLRARWTAYLEALQRFSTPGADPREVEYQALLEPRFLDTKDAADAVLALNQDAMVRRSTQLHATSERVNALLVAGVLLALLLGSWAAVNLTNRALRPVGVLRQAVRRVGTGDLAARAVVKGPAELEQLSADFNAMAARLQAYRESSLGELLQAQHAAQGAIDSLPDPVLVFGLGGQLLKMNRAAEATLGFSLDEPGEPLSRAAPHVREVLERVRTHVLSGKGAFLPRGYEEAVRLEGPEGPTFLLPRATPVYAEAALMGAAVVLQDVTRLRRFDELKNDLVATVAHEFRTPLTSLRMAVHLCAEQAVGPITEKQADLLFAAREDCERLQGIVDDLLDLSRIQSGSLELEKREVTPGALVDAALAAHAMAAEQRGVRLSTQLEPLAGRLEADPARVDLVLGNLLSNAIRHSPPGASVEVVVSQQGPAVRFEVRDRGEGISPEHQKRVFERFFRVPGTSREGAGLGLAIAREIVVAHHGDIGVESAPGQGSRFWFTLPLVASAAPA